MPLIPFQAPHCQSKPQELFLMARHSILVLTIHVAFFILTSICLGWREWRGRCKRGRLSYVSLFLGRDCCFGSLKPQQNSIVSFITNRGQLLHPLVGEFLLRCSLECLFCSRSQKSNPQCARLLL